MIQYKLTKMNNNKGIYGLEISRVLFIDSKRRTLTLKLLKGEYKKYELV